MRSALRVLFLAAEADPFLKVGGLGDVAGSLPPVIRRLGADIRLALPLHGGLRSKGFALQLLCKLELSIASGALPLEVYTLDGGELPVYFIAGEFIAPDAPVYTSDPQADGFKYTFFSLAALELCRYLNWPPDVLHVNDWHTAPAIYALSRNRAKGSFFAETGSVLGLNNLPYLGHGAENALAFFGLPAAKTESLPDWARQLPLPLGILTADRLVAVSPGYAAEILTPEFGAGLQGLLQSRRDRLTGILNGLDLQLWNPQTDPHLRQPYSPADLSLRQANKAALQMEMGLQVDARRLLLAIVSRMDYQKGIDLLPEALRRLVERAEELDRNWQIVILGAGDPLLEAAMHRLEVDFPHQARVVTRFDLALSHRIYAGADLLLIPSRYEPCGMTQMIAMRYGCVPLARATGGLRDTVRDIQQSADSTGFLFKQAAPPDLTGAVKRALRVYQNQAVWRALQLRGMRQDFSWQHSAQEYLKLYQELRDGRR